ncbi:hypothetical protein EO92_07895 [Methanosarcina sp. 2.H.A.1B.4]|nr:hypothetical protein EO92_07895 [Methanosarcina sp. 2.H.A.1B.4]
MLLKSFLEFPNLGSNGKHHVISGNLICYRFLNFSYILQKEKKCQQMRIKLNDDIVNEETF